MNGDKHLGLSLHPKLTFVNHISEKVSKARKGVGDIKYFSFCLLVKNPLIECIKCTFGRILILCCYMPHTEKLQFVNSSSRLSNLMDPIGRFQYQTALVVTGTWKGTNKICVGFRWERLSYSKWSHRVVKFYKIQNSFTPEHPKPPVPSPRTFWYQK